MSTFTYSPVSIHCLSPAVHCLNSLGLQSLYSNLWIENISIFVGGEVLVQMYEQGRGPQDVTTFMQALTCFPSLAIDSPCLHHHACWLQSLRLSGNMWLELSFFITSTPVCRLLVFIFFRNAKSLYLFPLLVDSIYSLLPPFLPH